MVRAHRRRDSLSSFILTLGVADMVIGGVGDRFSLFGVGLMTAGVGLLLRWARLKQRPALEDWAAPSRLKLLPPVDIRTEAQRRSRERRIY